MKWKKTLQFPTDCNHLIRRVDIMTSSLSVGWVSFVTGGSSKLFTLSEAVKVGERVVCRSNRCALVNCLRLFLFFVVCCCSAGRGTSSSDSRSGGVSFLRAACCVGATAALFVCGRSVGREPVRSLSLSHPLASADRLNSSRERAKQKNQNAGSGQLSRGWCRRWAAQQLRCRDRL